MYKQSVVCLNNVKASSGLLSDVFNPEFIYSSWDDKEYVCNTCHTALTPGEIPTQAIAIEWSEVTQYSTRTGL